MVLKIYNTLSRQKEEFVPRQPGQVTMYVCGVTVYASSHIGHAMSALLVDIGVCPWLEQEVGIGE